MVVILRLQTSQQGKKEQKQRERESMAYQIEVMEWGWALEVLEHL